MTKFGSKDDSFVNIYYNSEVHNLFLLKFCKTRKYTNFIIIMEVTKEGGGYYEK